MSRETDYLAARIARLEKERDDARRERDVAMYEAGAWATVAELKLPADQYESAKAWIEADVTERQRRTA